MKKAFTLAETLIVLCVIGVLAIIVLRSLGDLQPDKEKVMFKKAYSVTERAVGELVNDESIYPYDPDRIGFRNTDSANVEGTSESYSGAEKFCRFFSRKLNVVGDATFDATNSTCSFQTADGISWNVQGLFEDATEKVLIEVDVNGSDVDPNFPNDVTMAQVLADESLIDIVSHPELKQSNRDKFYIYVHFDGRVRVALNSLEVEFLKSHEARKTR